MKIENDYGHVIAFIRGPAKARREGYDAYNFGRNLNANPYASGDLHAAWKQGHKDAASDARPATS